MISNKQKNSISTKTLAEDYLRLICLGFVSLMVDLYIFSTLEEFLRQWEEAFYGDTIETISH